MPTEGDRSIVPIPPEAVKGETAQDALIKKLSGGKGNKYIRFVVAALSSLPWFGGMLGAAAGFSAEKEQEKINDLQRLWLEEYKEQTKELIVMFQDIFQRLDGFGDEIKERIESPEFLALVKRVFRSWDQADTQEKRQMLKRLITNAGATALCPDDLIRLFVNWIELYHEAHFLVTKEVYNHSGITRGAIWDGLHLQRPREDSAEADLFRYLIRELSTGGVIRQERVKNADGEFYKKISTDHRTSAPSKTMESAFEDTKRYELTELGKQFVHYVMDEVAPQIEGST